MRRTTTTSRSYKAAWLPLLLAVLLVPLVVAAIVAFAVRDDVQTDLAERSAQALASAGIEGATVSFDGRDATIADVPAGAESAAVKAVLAVDGVRVASVSGTAPGSDEADSSTEPAEAAFEVIVVDGEVTTSGSLPGESTDADLAADLAAALGTSPGSRSLSWDGTTATVSGDVATEKEGSEIEAALADLLPDATIDNQLEVVAASPEAQQLQTQVDALVASQPISFEANSAHFTPAGSQAIQQLATLLKAAPAAKIRVEGHVAATPGNVLDPRQLSEQRAEAVRARLVQLGIAADRITAEGFGDTEPIASNSTPEGQAANRRVEIVVL